MRRALMVIGSGLGLTAFWRRRRHRHELPEQTGPDPAEELRARLAESRAASSAVEEEPAPAPPAPGADEPIAAEPEPSPLDPQVRRQNVHERTRASIEELGSSD